VVCFVVWQAIYEIIGRDPEIEKIQRQITSGMAFNGQCLTQYLSTWDNYCEIWEINKDAFMRRYEKLNPQVSSFDADIGR
jgi:dynein heavy chain